ncbi:hypothetical protein [Bacillus sp. 2205SS5-2]|uniref:hypothetical protein n=1 Tax=Bacillus sp. 2205SS5-2 TaxID=3109031 RepID=UPI003006FC6D
MQPEECLSLLNSLRQREVSEILIQKENFLTFRQTLVEQEDFKYFRGNALQGGNVIYTYLNEERS